MMTLNKRFKKTILLALSAIIFSLTLTATSNKSDDYIRSRVVKLVSEHGACSGEQVKGVSGMSYILTAAHCKGLIENGAIRAITEDGHELVRRVIEEDVNSDLLLLEGLPNLSGLDIAKAIGPRQQVRSFTHGRRLDTYETKGMTIQSLKVMIGGADSTPQEIEECEKMPKNKLVKSIFGQDCVIETVNTVVIMVTMPGSSGGPVVNSRGDLVGVVSGGDGVLSMLVSLQDIQKLLASY